MIFVLSDKPEILFDHTCNHETIETFGWYEIFDLIDILVSF